jgi:ribonuclease HII
MVELAKQVHPDFDWESNKGYHCAKHVEALKKHGATKWHRKQFIKNFI